MKQPTLKRDDLVYPDLSYKIVGCSFEVFKSLGYGHPEKVYQRAMAILFDEKIIPYTKEEYIPIKFRNKIVNKQFIDFVVEEKVIVELKKNFHFSKAHIDQVLYYMQEKNLKLAILINFGKEGATFKRIVNVKENV
ncbi:MAG: GxxExxY protein [Bacteroidetes bacterium]|nr:GxxExxY protein [Bacteroidota bacterium]